MSSNFDPELLRQYMMGAAKPSQSKIGKLDADTFDLHINKKNGELDLLKGEELSFQKEIYEKIIDSAIASGKQEIRLIHGNGSGKLKSELHAYLRKHKNVSSFDDTYHPKYGFGSTVVYFY